MKIGVSTACFYPEETETALEKLSMAGINAFEIFFNADCELRGEIYGKIRSTVLENNLSVLSVHPYTSAVETMSLFGDYPRRLAEITDTYKRYFEIMNELGAKVFVLHGALKSAICSMELYFERYSLLYEEGKRWGVTVAQENVSYCKGGSLEFLKEMKSTLKENCGFVLDVKQALRGRIDPFEIMDTLGDSLVHFHLSDHTDSSDCVPVGKGNFDFLRFVEAVKRTGSSGNIILELYRSGFGDIKELKESIEYMDVFLKKMPKNT